MSGALLTTLKTRYPNVLALLAPTPPPTHTPAKRSAPHFGLVWLNPFTAGPGFVLGRLKQRSERARVRLHRGF